MSYEHYVSTKVIYDLCFQLKSYECIMIILKAYDNMQIGLKSYGYLNTSIKSYQVDLMSYMT